MKPRSALTLLFCLGLGSIASAQFIAPLAPSQRTREQFAVMQLSQMRYFVDTTKSGNVAINKQAIIAFQKVHRLKRSGILSNSLIDTILRSRTPHATDSSNLRHVEVDLARQILFVVDSNNTVESIISVSTGNGKRFLYPDKGWRYAITPKGCFTVYYKIKGWRTSKLGFLYNPMYVVGGVAIHGALDVPPKPASHGCIRIPFFAADKLFSMISIGTPVLIH